jgi:hypothetical protein
MDAGWNEMKYYKRGSCPCLVGEEVVRMFGKLEVVDPTFLLDDLLRPYLKSYANLEH